MFEMRIVKLNDNSVISLARDISKRKQAELKIEEARKKAEEADQLKTAFLANISHVNPYSDECDHWVQPNDWFSGI